jgi:endonuclease/exonuclease/phosphatase family metal-dependent hydrolase
MDKYQGQDLSTMDEYQWQLISSSLISNKSLKQVINLANIILEQSPDLLLLVEVGGEESLNNFNQYFLNNLYDVYTIEGNSDRGIELGYLVKKSLHGQRLLQSHRDRPLNFAYPSDKKNKIKRTYYFSRDVLQLDLVLAKQSITFLLIHLKSKLDKDRIDPQGYLRREAELKELIRLYLELKSRSSAPIVVAGDFNGIAQKADTDVEFRDLYSLTQLEDCLEMFHRPEKERYTHLHMPPSGRIVINQIDYVFTEKSHKHLKVDNAQVLYLVEDYLSADPAQLFKFKRNLPSDHFPYLFELEIDA